MLNVNMAKVIRVAKRRRTISITFSMVVLVLAIWGFVVEPASLRNEDYEIAVPRWPVGCDGLRVAVLADLHVGSPFNRLGKLDSIVATTERARPDLVLLAGDYVIHGVAGGQFTPPETIAASLRRLWAPLGVWAVLGNHDWWYDAPRVRSALEGVGIPGRAVALRPALRCGPCRRGRSAPLRQHRNRDQHRSCPVSRAARDLGAHDSRRYTVNGPREANANT